jgi:hypothetical protein
MAVVEIAEEYKKVLWNQGGSSDEIFRHGRRHLVGIASPASDYLRALPQWLAIVRLCLIRAAVAFYCTEAQSGCSPRTIFQVCEQRNCLTLGGFPQSEPE